MEFYRYYEFFLNIEGQLCEYIHQLEYTDKSKNLYSPKISLLLLQTCPVIESYMVHLCTNSSEVKSSPLYDWEYNYKLWDSQSNVIKEEGGKRSVKNFPKFAYIVENVFGLSKMECLFYHSDKFQNLEGKQHYQTFMPYKSLKSFIDYNGYKQKKARERFPVGLNTPTWWTAYNKIKHDLDAAQSLVTYETAIEAISALFLLLSLADTEYKTLENNSFKSDKEIRTKLFSCYIP